MKLPKELTTVTPLSRIAAVIVLVSVMVIGFGLGVNYQETIDLAKKQNNPAQVIVTPSSAPSLNQNQATQITKEEKQRIDRWIAVNNRNQYGDPKDTVYIGGTPIFNEATGERIDRYEYIIKKHPDMPWNK